MHMHTRTRTKDECLGSEKQINKIRRTKWEMNKKTKNKMQKSYDAIRMRKATQLLLLCEIVCVCVCVIEQSLTRLTASAEEMHFQVCVWEAEKERQTEGNREREREREKDARRQRGSCSCSSSTRTRVKSSKKVPNTQPFWKAAWVSDWRRRCTKKILLVLNRRIKASAGYRT